MSPLIITGVKKLRFKQLSLMLVTFFVVFGSSFGNLIGCFEISSIKVATVAVALGSLAGVSVTFSTNGRYAKC